MRLKGQNMTRMPKIEHTCTKAKLELFAGWTTVGTCVDGRTNGRTYVEACREQASPAWLLDQEEAEADGASKSRLGSNPVE